MKKTVSALAVAALALLASVPAAGSPEGVHAEKFPCTRCHVTNPGPDATLEEAPLVAPIHELCASCHPQE